MTKDKSNLKSVLIIICVSLLVIIASCFIGAKLLTNLNTDKPQTPTPPEITMPTIFVEEEINVYVSDYTTEFLYFVQNLGDYEVTFFIANQNIAEFDGNIIRPKTVGTTKITITINTIPQTTKETKLNILPVVTDVEFNITDNLGNEVNEFYTNCNYCLVVTENNATNLTSTVLGSENVTIEFIKNENLSYYYNFQILEEGEFELRYKNKYYQEWITFNASKKLIDFQVNIANSKLYLFDMNYVAIANNNNLVNCSNFEIIVQDNVNDIVELIEYDKNILEIINNKIIAKSAGKTKLKFRSTLSKIEKDYEIIVEEISLNKILINNIEFELNSTINLDINANELINFSFSKIPIYCNDVLSINYNNEEVKYLNGQLSIINNATKSVVYLKDKIGTNIITINLNVIATYRIDVNISNQNYINIKLEDDVIEVPFEKDGYISLTVHIVDEITNLKLHNQTPKVNIEKVDICEIEDDIINGVLNIKIKSVGETIIKISYDEYEIELNLTIRIF